MKRIDWRKKFVKLSQFLLRVLILILRIYITSVGLILIIGGTLGVWGGSMIYLGNLIMGIIFIFPFRRLRESHLMTYLWLLAINSVWQAAMQGSTTPWYMAWIDNFANWMNVLVVWQWVHFELKTSGFNPFFPGKMLLKLFGGLTILLIVIFVYMFFDLM